MTPTEIDKLCCEFAGIEPLWRVRYRGNPLVDKRHPEGYLSSRYDREWAEKMMGQSSRYGTPVELVAEYPPISTSWEAAGRLMDALAKSCSTCNTVSQTVKQFFGASCPMCHGKPAIWVSIHNAHGSWVAVVRNSGCTQQAQGEHESGPMALALAVAALARESR